MISRRSISGFCLNPDRSDRSLDSSKLSKQKRVPLQTHLHLCRQVGCPHATALSAGCDVIGGFSVHEDAAKVVGSDWGAAGARPGAAGVRGFTSAQRAGLVVYLQQVESSYGLPLRCFRSTDGSRVPGGLR